MSRESSLPIPLYNKQVNKHRTGKDRRDKIPLPAIIVFFQPFRTSILNANPPLKVPDEKIRQETINFPSEMNKKKRRKVRKVTRFIKTEPPQMILWEVEPAYQSVIATRESSVDENASAKKQTRGLAAAALSLFLSALSQLVLLVLS